MHSPAIHHISFYKFVAVADPAGCAETLRAITGEVLGSILVASEGINGMLSGTADALDRFEHALANDTRFEGTFGGIHFKRTPCQTPPFQKMKVHHKPEILPLGVDGVNAIGRSGIDVSPAEWRELIAQDDVVLIDNRNSFEFRLGHFRNAVDPQVGNFRDFPRYVEAHIDEWKAQGKRVAMYCTGGIRCEKTGAWMQDLGMPTYQLQGGILNYFAQIPDADRDWQGECFVFDNRVALDTHLQETGTPIEAVYAGDPDEQWRLQRARKLAQAVDSDDAKPAEKP